MKIVNANKFIVAISFLIIWSLPSIAQTISQTTGTTTMVLVAGGEVFADPNDGVTGGLGGDCSTTNSGNSGDYPNCNCVTVTTLTAPAGNQVSVTFNQFRVFSNFDWLAIFDGNATVTASNGSGSATNPTSTDPLLWNSSVDGDELSDMLAASSITFTSTNGSLTFASRFSGVVNTCGWQADVAIQPIIPLVTSWDVQLNDTIIIPLQSGMYDFDYKWILTTDTAVQIVGNHTNADGDFMTAFVDAGIYELEIIGSFPHLKGYPEHKLLDVHQWGDVVWQNLHEMFRGWPGASFSALDTPDFSQVTNMTAMFRSAANFSDDLNHWDVSNVSNMTEVFRSSNFNGDISDWNVGNVTSFNGMFQGCTQFNQDISNWDVSNVENMRKMFETARAFNQPIGKWDISKVVNFRTMLNGCINFNQNLGNWEFNPQVGDVFGVFLNANNFSCPNWSQTIIGWNENNPNLDSLLIGGPITTFDTFAVVARDSLIARGWMINGTLFNGRCVPCEAERVGCESFEQFPLGPLGGKLIDCWTNVSLDTPQWIVKTGLTSSVATGPSGALDGEQYIYLETSVPAEQGELDILTSPVFDISSLTAPRLSFFYHMFGEDIGSLIYEISEDLGQNWIAIDTIIGQQQTNLFDPWELVTFDLNTFGPSVMVRFIGVAGSSFNGDIALDRICIDESPLCGDIHSLSTTRIGDHDILLNWVSEGGQDSFVVSFGPEGILPGQGTVVQTFADSLLITGLSPNVNFTVYVQGFCGSIPADKILTITSVFSSNDLCETSVPLFCGDTMIADLINSRLTSPFLSSSCNNDSTAIAGHYYQFTGTGEEIMLTLNSDTASFLFFDAIVFNGACSTLQCFDESFDFNFISELDSIYTILITNFAFAAGAYELSIQCDSCYDPRDVEIINVGLNNAEVTWTPGTFASRFQVEFDTTGFNLGTGTIINDTIENIPVVLENLVENTGYEFYLFEFCNGQATDTLGPFSFTTLCSSVFTAPYCEGFDNERLGELNGEILSCWQNTKVSRPEWSIDLNETASSSTGPNGPQVGNRYIFLECSGGSQGDADTLTSPLIDISDLANAELSFFAHMFGSSMGTLKWEISQDFGVTFIPLDSLVGEQQSSSSADWMLIRHDLAAFSDTIIVRFIGIRGNGFRSDMAIDEICIKEKICPEIINISGDQSDQTFTASDDITSSGKVISGLVTYRFGEELNLIPGFEVVLGAEFDIIQSDCALD